MKSGKMIILVGLVALCFGSVQAFSEEGESSQGSVSERARLKRYPGGVDDGDLQVQEELLPALRKVSKKEIEKKVYEDLLSKDEEKTSQ